MYIDQNIMDKIHDTQYEMLKELIRVMNILKINYYFVHGSLLGALRDNEFIAEDDDIDIAIFREDYNRLMYHGQTLLSPGFFLQNSVNDSFPLSFGKMRNSETAFIQPVLSKIDCNKGIYIDIFPLDYDTRNPFFCVKKTILETRIHQLLDNGKKGWKRKSIELIAKILCTSYERALLKREVLFSSVPKGRLLVIHGGKSTEKQMPVEWFESQVCFKFRDIEVTCPSGYDAYLTRIYGEDYLNHNPAGSRISNQNIEISADILDLENSYLDYILPS